MGGPSAEHEVSLASGKLISKALDQEKYDVVPIVISKEGSWHFKDDGQELAGGAALDALKTQGIEVVFIAMHGTYGEDGTIQGMLEMTGLPYTGSKVLASALAMHKAKSNEIFAFHGLRVPRYVHFTKSNWENDEWRDMDMIAKLGFPLVVKPVNLGSSVAVTIVRSREELAEAIDKVFSHGAEVMAQEYVEGIEVTCGVLDDGTPYPLPPTQIKSKDASFFDYDSKYIAGASEELTPAPLEQGILDEIQSTALKAHMVLGCAGMSRTDMIVSGNNVYVLETNTIPGMTETSLLPQAAKVAGFEFPELLDKMINAALR